MKLSILIPTYNFDPRKLVQDLQAQLPEDAEILVGDDSPPHNIGRAARRNALAREAKGEWLLFIDADAEVRSTSFLADYLAYADGKMFNNHSSVFSVFCGGTGNLPTCPRPEAKLRYDYEVQAEKRLTLAQRRAHPYDGFTTFNFMIRRDLFLDILFDERLKQYGHEDTLFGLELKRRGIPVLHIDNKLTHLGLEDAKDYLQKTETALRTLSQMSQEQKQNVRVSRLAEKLNHWHLLPLTSYIFRLTSSLIKANLLGKHPSQLLFAFYKLGYYAEKT